MLTLDNFKKKKSFRFHGKSEHKIERIPLRICTSLLLSSSCTRVMHLLTADEPTLTLHYHKKSIIYIQVHLVMCILLYNYICIMTCIVTCILHYTIIQRIFTALKVLCAPPIHSSQPSSPWKPLIFTVSAVFLFLKCCIVRNIMCSLFRLAY